MSDNNTRPQWRWLNLIVLLAVGLLALDGRTHLSELGHEAAEIGIVLATFGLIGLWLLANAGAISNGPPDRRW
jgi:hypothetical protein